MTVGAGLYLSPSETDTKKQNAAIRQLIEGRSNSVFSATLTSNSTTTTITSPTIGPNSALLWQPTTSAASPQMTVMYVSSLVAGTAILTHGSNAASNQTFNFVAIG